MYRYLRAWLPAISAYNLGYKISVPAEGVASFNQKGHEWALAHFKNSLGAEVNDTFKSC